MNEHKIIEVENEKPDSEDNLIIESVNKFLEKDVKPYVKEFESQDKYPQDIANKMADLGLFGATITPEYVMSIIHISEPTRLAGISD